MTFDLPEGWKLLTVTELAGPGGVVADGDWIESKDQDPDGDVRLIQLADIGDGDFQNRSARFLTSAKARELGCTLLETGDLLIARMPDPLGRACLFPGVGQPSVTAVDVFIWRAGKKAADPRWLMYAINSPQVRDHLLNIAGGSTRQRVSGGNLKRLTLPTPPRPLQLRIASKVQRLLSRSRHAKDELRTTLRLTSRYRRQLLSTIFDQASTCGVASPLGSLISGIDAGKNMRCEERQPRGGERGIVKISAVTWGHFDAREIKTVPDYAALDPRTLISNGDFLLSRANTLELVGAPVIAEGVPENTYLSDKVLRIRFHDHLDRWVLWFLRSPQGRSEIESRSSGNQLSMRNIGQGAIREIPIPMPDRSVRDALSRRVEASQASIDRIERDANHALTLCERLEQSILDLAFRGDLMTTRLPQISNELAAAE